jgi:hypothetical protein
MAFAARAHAAGQHSENDLGVVKDASLKAGAASLKAGASLLQQGSKRRWAWRCKGANAGPCDVAKAKPPPIANAGPHPIRRALGDVSNLAGAVNNRAAAGKVRCLSAVRVKHPRPHGASQRALRSRGPDPT